MPAGRKYVSARAVVSARYAILAIASADAQRDVQISEPIFKSKPWKSSSLGAINWREAGEVGRRVTMSESRISRSCFGNGHVTFLFPP